MLPRKQLQVHSELLPAESLSKPKFDIRPPLEEIAKTDEHELNPTNISSEGSIFRQTTSWRWVIVFSSFCAHFVADGILFSFGILMHVIKEDLNVELHEVGIIASLFVSLPLFLAPLSGALVNKIGCRLVTMIGGILCTIGSLVASITGTFIGSIIGIGVLCGAGLSCVYVPAVVIVAHYFDENRAIATAIAVGGTGLGNALVAQLIHFLNTYYDDWRSTALFLSGVFFTIVGFGALFRPVEFGVNHKDENHDSSTGNGVLPTECMTSKEKLQRFIDNINEQSKPNNNTHTANDITQSYEMKDLNATRKYLGNDNQTLINGLIDRIDVKTNHETKSNLRHYSLLKRQSRNENENPMATNLQMYFSADIIPCPTDQELLEVLHQPINQKDIFYPGNVPLKTSHLSRRSCPDLLQLYAYENSIASMSDDDHDSISGHHRHRILLHRKGLTFLHTLRRMLGLELFRDYRYLIFFLSQFLFYLFYDLIYLFPVDYGEKGIGYSKEQMTMLVTILGFGQFFGQISYGLLANYTCVDSSIYYSIGGILCGISSLLVPFVVHSYTALVVTILLFGLSISANYALTPVILATMCGLESLTSAYGLILLGQGLSSLFGPVIGGWIAEKHGYEASLIVAGLFMGFSGLVTLLIPLIERIRSMAKETNSEKLTNKNNTTTTFDTSRQLSTLNST